MRFVQGVDQGTLYWFGKQHRPWLNDVAQLVTHLGDYRVLGPFAVLCIALLFYLRRPRLAVVLTGVALMAYGLQYGVKFLVARPRPSVPWHLIAIPREPSFPSGHALCGMAIYFATGLLLSRVVRRRWLMYVLPSAGVVLGLISGLTRIYLGVHYPLDVVGGWIGGLFCAVLGLAVADNWERKEGAECLEGPE